MHSKRSKNGEHENALDELNGKQSGNSSSTELDAMTLINIGCVHEWMFAMCCQSKPKSSLKRFIPVACVRYGWTPWHFVRCFRYAELFVVFLVIQKDRNICLCFLPKISVVAIVCFWTHSQHTHTHTHRKCPIEMSLFNIRPMESKCFRVNWLPAFLHCLPFHSHRLSETFNLFNFDDSIKRLIVNRFVLLYIYFS